MHGCFKSLRALIRKIRPQKKDRFVFLGDYIDRGPQSREVVDFLINFSTKYDCVFLRGNHEAMLLDYLHGGPWGKYWELNGMEATLRSYGGLEGIPENHIQFFENTKLYHTDSGYLFVHAGIRPGIPLEMQKSEDLLWIREDFIYYERPFKKGTVIFGHTPNYRAPLILEGKIGIDTGCVFGGSLTALRVDDMKFFSVDCAETKPQSRY
nr:metallophosphoesterase family protein [Kosmotoga pacifica]